MTQTLQQLRVLFLIKSVDWPSAPPNLSSFNLLAGDLDSTKKMAKEKLISLEITVSFVAVRVFLDRSSSMPEALSLPEHDASGRPCWHNLQEQANCGRQISG
jgi:hypothetical protein